MRTELIVAALALSIFAASAAGQAPMITPAGDPSVRSDTIYALAVDPASHPDHPYVLLLDDGVVVHEADGHGRSTYRQVVQILTREGAEAWGELSFGYVAGRQKLVVNWVRVIGPRGEIVSGGPIHEEELSEPTPPQYPVYTDARTRRVTLAGVAPGTIVDWSYTVETLEPVLRGDFGAHWFVTMPRLVRRSRLIVDVPVSLAPRIQEWNVRFPRRTYERSGRRVYVWATADVPPVEREPYAAWPNQVDVAIRVGAPLTWDDVARWYAELARDRYAVSPELEDSIAQTVAGARSLDDSLRAVHRWISQEFRYVSLAFGMGGYRPRPPAEVLRTRLGDCKDKVTLFIAVARRMGVAAYPVLVALDGQPDSTMPTVASFDHVIAAIERPDGYVFADLTAERSPYGQLAQALQGEFGLLVRPEGAGVPVTVPADPPLANREASVIVGELSSGGVFTGRLGSRWTGSQADVMRAQLAQVEAMSERQRGQFARVLANGVFEGATGDGLEWSDNRDLTADPRVSIRIHVPRAASPMGEGYILTLPQAFSVADELAALESQGPRRYPLDLGALLGPAQSELTVEATLPPGWRATLPTGVTATSAFGSYTSEYRQEGRTLSVVRRFAGRRGVEPPQRIDELLTWLRAVTAADVRYVALTRHGN